MPLHEYKCSTCNFEFEELKKVNEDVETSPCKKCGSPAKRKISLFSSVVSGGSPTESIDMTIGREAEKRWQVYGDRQSKRHKDKNIQVVDVPKTKTGEFMPVMGLGNQKDRETRKEYSTALQEHREQRIKRGQSQFQGMGDF